MKNRNISGRTLSAFAAAVIAVSAVFPAPSATGTVYAGQQLGQTTFDDGTGLPWHIVESDPGKVDFSIDGGSYNVTIVNPGGSSRGGEDRWDCQFRHRGLKIVSGHKYEVKYDITATESGMYYTKIGNLDGDVEIWHNNMSDSGPDFNSSWDLIHIDANKKNSVSLTFTASKSMDVAEWAFHLGGSGQYTPQDCFPEGTTISFDNMSLIDLTSDENDYTDNSAREKAAILTNQLGYFTNRAKRATLITDSDKETDFTLKDASGSTVYTGKTKKFGMDEDSGDKVQIIDFSDFTGEGSFYLETEDGSQSREFTIGGASEYVSMLYDSLNYFYQNRSGIAIESEYISSGDKSALARAAGHPSDNAEIEQTWGYSGSSGSVDVTGGWYDAGDHGKYVVNGGFSLWMMQNQYETAVNYGFENIYADGKMLIPENSNSFPDLLDEARWEMEWMMTMVVDSGDYEGMVYHKVHDEKWTALALAPADDTMKRIVKPPSTAATLNFAACAAQASRLWKGIDDSFSEKCLEAAEKSYKAAKEHPDMLAPLDESTGGGAYGDTDVDDEFYWAAMELFITTGNEDYYDDTTESQFFLDVPTTLGGGESVDTVGSFDWGNTALLGTFSAALNPDSFDKGDVEIVKDAFVKAADHYVELENKQGYGVPYAQSTLSYNDSDKGYIWGSNSFVADNSIVMAYGYLLTGNDVYLDGAVGGMDYLLGRNAMDYSYVTGYGSNTTENPHHRYWANQVDPSFPKAPCGVMAGGPNSGMQDPFVQGQGWKKGEIAPQKCYIDNIEAWSVNECTINWNASLAWLTAFIAQENGGLIQENDKTVDKSDEGQKEQHTKAAKESETSAKTTDNKKPDAPNGENKGNLPVVAVISGAAVIALISLELFIYKLVKLKKK